MSKDTYTRAEVRSMIINAIRHTNAQIGNLHGWAAKQMGIQYADNLLQIEDRKADPVFTTLDEVKKAVLAGNSVQWLSDDYSLEYDIMGETWYIRGFGLQKTIPFNSGYNPNEFYFSNTEIIPYK